MNEPGETRWQFEDTARFSRIDFADISKDFVTVLEFAASVIVRSTLTVASSKMNSGASMLMVPAAPDSSITAFA